MRMPISCSWFHHDQNGGGNGGGFFLACEDFGRMFDYSFPLPALFCLFVFLSGD